jgi:tetratricopeptide (TPR) repeat protein
MNPIHRSHVAFLHVQQLNAFKMKKIIFALILSFFFLLGNAQTLQEGIKHMENENYTAALQTFQSLCQADPKNASVYYYIGEVHYALEDYKEAEKSYRKGLTINSSCSECNIGLGKLELDKGNTTEAEKYFDAAIRADKRSSTPYGLVGDAYLYSKKPNASKAIEYLTQARDLDPKIARYWAHLGDAFQLAGDNGEAVTHYERAVEKDPTNAEAYISMARIWARAQQVDLAIPHLEEAISLSPNDARPIKDLYELYIRERKYDKVVPLLEKYITLIGTDIDAKVRLVKFLTFQAKDFDRAIEEGEKLLPKYSEQYTIYRWLAWSYAGKAKQIEEDKTLDNAVADSLAKMNYEKAYENSKKLFEALGKDDSRKAFSEDYEFWALSALKLGLVDEAAHVYRKYLEFDPSKAPDIYGMLAKTYFDSTNYTQAVAYYNRKLELKPLTNADEYYLGLSHYYSNQFEQADTSFAKVLRATPNFASGYFWRARIADKIDSSEVKIYLAKPFYESYIEYAGVDPERNKRSLLEAYYYLAYYWAQQEDYEKAKEYFNKMLAIDPENKTALENLEILKNPQNR